MALLHMLSICLEAPETLLAITAVAFKFRVDFFDTTASAALEIVHASLQGSCQHFRVNLLICPSILYNFWLYSVIR